MECPNCKHEAFPTSLIECAHCGKSWDRAQLEEYENIEYILRWLSLHRQQIGPEVNALLGELNDCLEELERSMGIARLQRVTEAAEPPPAVFEPVDSPVVSLEPALAIALEPVPTPELALVSAAVAPIPAVPEAPPKPKAPPPPPKPARPPVDWSKVWDKAVNFVVSGALLRALLYLGAFMIVVSAAVLVINFWDIFPPILQALFIFALPTVFYAAGWLVRSRLKLVQAGMVLTGVGEILLAVDFAALYQFSNLNINFSLYWLIASLFTTTIYAFTAYRLDGEFFDYLALIGGANILVALSRLAGASLDWAMGVVTLSGLGMVGLSAWAWEKGETWRDTARAARYLPQVVIPISLLALLANGWNTQPAMASAFLCAAAAYGLLAWKFPALHQLVLSLACFALSVAFGLGSLHAFNWMAAAAAVVSAAYILGGRFLPLEQSKISLANRYRKVLIISGFLLAAISVILVLWYAMAFRYDLEVAVALTLLALSFCSWNVLFRQPLHGYIGCLFLLLAAGAWFNVISLDFRFIASAYLVLISAANLPAAILLGRIDKKLAAPFEHTGWLVAAWIFANSMMAPVWAKYSWVPALTLTLLSAYLAFHTYQYRSQAFAWGTAIVIPFAMARWVNFVDMPSVYRAFPWTGLALLYMLVERFLHQKKDTPWESLKIRRPFGAGIAVLTAIGIVIAYDAYFRVAEKQIPLVLVAQVLSIGMVILSARVYRRRWPLFVEPFLAATLAVAFFVTYADNLFRFMEIYEYGLVLCGAAWLHLLIAAGIDKLKTRYAHGLYFGGYAMLALAVFVSLFDLFTLLWTFGLFIVAMVFSAVLIQAGRHNTWTELAGVFGKPEVGFVQFVRSLFVWAAAWLFPVWCALLLVHLRVPAGYFWLGVSVPALLYLPLGNRLGKLNKQYETAFFSAGHAFTLLALSFSVGRVLSAASQVAADLPIRKVEPFELYISQGIVQALAAAFYSAWAWMKKSQAFCHVASWLSILPFTSLLLLLIHFSQGVAVTWIVVAWAVWASLLLLAGFWLDRPRENQPRFSHGPYLAGYSLLFLSLVIAAANTWVSIIVLAICILCAACSFVALHLGRHAAFEDFIKILWPKEGLSKRAARLLFLFFAVYALPVWAATLEGYYKLSWGWQGITLALLAPVYIAAGVRLRRLDPDYTWPFYSAGYALTAIGAMIAFDDPRIATYVLALDILMYAASAVIFRQSFWLYLAAILTPINILIFLDHTDRLTPQWATWIFTGLAFLYFGIGQWLDRRKTDSASLHEFAPPFYIPGYLLSAIALAVSLASNDRILALWVFPMNILLYALSAWRFREPLFLYPAAWLSSVPYYLFITTFLNIRTEWLGATWLPLILALIGLGRFVFHRAPVQLNTPKAIISTLANHSAIPFYTIAYILSVTMILGSRWTPLSLTIGSALATLLYFGSALLFRHPSWLYPSLLAAHLGVIAFFSINPSGSPIRYISLPFLALTWLEAIAGFIVSRDYPVSRMTTGGRLEFKLLKKIISFGEFPSVGFLTIPSWAQPIFIFLAFDIVLWESVALTGLDTGTWVSAGFFILLAVLAMAWKDQLLAHLSLAFALTAAGFQLGSMGMSTPQVFASLSGLAFLLFLLSWLVELAPAMAMWRRPLVRTATISAGLALLVTLPLAFQETIPTAYALGFNGAIYLTMSLRKRTYLLGYFGMGLLLAGWSLFLFVRNIEQPQFYAIPAGLYFTGMGFFEHTRRPGRFAMLIESLGLALLLVTSFVQSLDGSNGFPYFLLLFVESLLVVWWGAARHVRVPFIAGLAASVINVLAQIVVLVKVYEVNRWIIIFSAGILLVGLGLFVERRREILLSRAQEFRGMLETWE